MDSLLDRPALELAALLKRGEVTSEELTRGYCERIERWNPHLTAFVDFSRRKALASARARDRERRAGRERSPLHGIPIGIKDLNLVRGFRARFGSRAWRWVWSPIDDVISAHIRRGGCVVIGKLATSEFGALPVTEPDIHPPTRNPWNPAITAGGSSGGSASALAAGLIPLAHGSDGAGSIRIPSSFCHLFGHKPSRGRLPNPYNQVDRIDISTVGPICHTVEDAAALLAVMGGDMRLPVLPSPGRQRIRFTTRGALVETRPEIAVAVEGVARTLAGLGHSVEEGPPIRGELEEFLPIWQRQVAEVPVLRESVLQPATRWLREAGRRLPREQVRAAHRALGARILEWFGDADLWLTPTVAVAPPQVGAWLGLEGREIFHQAAPLGQFTAPFNVTGQPAASLPAGLSAAGLPIGVQLVGRLGADELVLAVSKSLEEAMPWRQRRAPLEALAPSASPGVGGA